MTGPQLPLVPVLDADDRAADHFWAYLEDRSVRFLPYQLAPIFSSTLREFVAGRGDPAARRAGLAVLARMYRRFGLQSYHDTCIAAAMVDTVRRFPDDRWGQAPAGAWERGCRRALRLADRAAGVVGEGPQVTVGEVEARESPSDGVTVLTVRPMRRLRYLPGQALPVGTLRRPGQWRWLSPANAPRPDGTVDFHVRAVPGGRVSPLLVRQVAAGETLWLGPPCDVGLSLAAAGEADLLLVAGGTGLAPLRALVDQVAAAPGGRRVTLVVGTRTVLDLYDAVAVDRLAHTHPDWLTVVLAFSADPDVDPAVQGDVLSLALYHYRRGQAIYVCGPTSLIVAARRRLPLTGIPAGDVHLATTFDRALDTTRWTNHHPDTTTGRPDSGTDDNPSDGSLGS